MVHSTWGSSFLREEIEATDPERLTMWYLGCNGFVIRSPESTLYLDPYFGDGFPPSLYRMIPVPLDPADVAECDGVLVTHEHVDHFHPASYGPILEQTDCDIHAPAACFEDPQIDWEDQRVPDDQKHTIEPGDEFEIGDLTIHVRGGNDPDGIGEVTFVIEHDSGVFFNAGDSRYTDDFRAISDEFDINVGTIVFGSVNRVYFSQRWADEGVVDEPGTFEIQSYMDENDVIRSADALELDRLVPVHWDIWKGGMADPKVLHEHAESFAYPRSVEVANIGDRFHVDRYGIQPLRNVDTH